MTRWEARRERGSTALLRVMIWITLHLGWRASRVLLYGIAAYFFASSATARAASHEFLNAALGRPARLRDGFRHVFTFAAVIHERAFFLADRLDGFDIAVEGLDALRTVIEGGRGCVLLGAHVGSYEVLRVIGRHSPVRVRPMMYRRNATAVTRLLEALDPAMAAAIIEIGRPDTMLEVRESLERGEIVGMLADRAPGDARALAVGFFGRPAAFPTGPFIAAASLGAPVLLFWGIRTGARRYRVRFEPFADCVAVPRENRKAALRGLIERYAAALEAECRRHPFNWFNFYPFWGTSPR